MSPPAHRLVVIPAPLVSMSDIAVSETLSGELARADGLGTSDSMRRHIQHCLGRTPGAYRASFGGPTAAPVGAAAL